MPPRAMMPLQGDVAGGRARSRSPSNAAGKEVKPAPKPKRKFETTTYIPTDFYFVGLHKWRNKVFSPTGIIRLYDREIRNRRARNGNSNPESDASL